MVIKTLLFEWHTVFFKKGGKYVVDVILEWLVSLSGIVVLRCSSIWRFLLLNSLVKRDQICIAKDWILGSCALLCHFGFSPLLGKKVFDSLKLNKQLLRSHKTAQKNSTVSKFRFFRLWLTMWCDALWVCVYIYIYIYYIIVVWCDLVPVLQFKKHEKHTWRSVLQASVCNFFKSNTPRWVVFAFF